MYHFIVNIRGGSGKAFLKWKKIVRLLKEKNVEYKAHITQYQGHASEIARELSSGSETVNLIVIGGDGAVNEVVNGIADFSKIRLGLIPTGSGNDFSRGLKIPRKNPKKALEKILKSDGNQKIDLGRTTVLSTGESKLFGISSGYGLNAIVGTSINSARIKKILNFIHLGSLSYAFYTVQTLFTMKTQSVTLRFDDEKPVSYNKLIFIANQNSFCEGGGVPMTPKAQMNDGYLSFCMAAGLPRIVTFFAFPMLCLGLHSVFPGFMLKNYKKLEIESESPTILHTDGELMGNVEKVRWEVVPSILNVLV
ncbi:MAG: diacylglycerol kinase family lipid kinase [Treponema sp.]|nr:diacylglycerol kinase family lipid kinase [Candidatus Treponema equifaecale]